MQAGRLGWTYLRDRQSNKRSNPQLGGGKPARLLTEQAHKSVNTGRECLHIGPRDELGKGPSRVLEERPSQGSYDLGLVCLGEESISVISIERRRESSYEHCTPLITIESAAAICTSTR